MDTDAIRQRLSEATLCAWMIGIYALILLEDWRSAMYMRMCDKCKRPQQHSEERKFSHRDKNGNFVYQNKETCIACNTKTMWQSVGSK